MGIRRQAEYKQMAFDTAVRNPERYLQILGCLKEYEGKILDDVTLLDIVCTLYLKEIVKSPLVEINEFTQINDIRDRVIEVNKTRNGDGGFPKGYQSRFWTYMRTPSEFGLIYARYNSEFKFSNILTSLLEGKLDEQQVFSIQAIKTNRKSPYRNVSNDYNYFRFILGVLLKLRERGSNLSYEQFTVSLFSRDGNVDDFIKLLDENKFGDENSTYEYIKNTFKTTNKFQTVMRDYPDVVRRVLIISGFITIRYSGVKIMQLNENKINYIMDLISKDFHFSDEEKENDLLFFNKMNESTSDELEILNVHSKEDVIDAIDYLDKLHNLINTYNISEDIVVKMINNIGSRTNIIEEFREISEPLKLEFYISLLIAIRHGKDLLVKPNYKADHLGKPYSHAPGNMGDIEVYGDNLFWLIEVTLMRNNKQQLNNETTSVIRHFSSDVKISLDNYLSFVAPYIHEDTKEFYNFQLFKYRNEKIYIKPYSIEEFLNITMAKRNFNDMKDYKKSMLETI